MMPRPSFLQLLSNLKFLALDLVDVLYSPTVLEMQKIQLSVLRLHVTTTAIVPTSPRVRVLPRGVPPPTPSRNIENCCVDCARSEKRRCALKKMGQISGSWDSPDTKSARESWGMGTGTALRASTWSLFTKQSV